MSDPSLVYRPVQSVVPFLLSGSMQSFIVGPVGSTKTTASLIKILAEAKKMAPCADGIRRSRCAVIRNTNQQLRDSTLADFLRLFPEGGAGAYLRTEMKFILKLDDVECEILFRGLDDTNDVRRLLSLQLSFAMLDEVREINPDVFNALTGRVGRYPNGMMVPHRPEWGVDEKGNPIQGCVDDNGKQMKKVWGATNPADADTFWEQYLSDPPESVHVTIQPSGLAPEADWVQHLPSGYYEDLMVGKSEEWIDVYIHGKWGKSLSGQPVFRCFNRDTHVAKEPVQIMQNTLVIGVDAGLNPTAVITQQTYDGRVLVHDAITGNEGGMGALRFIREKLKPLLANKYPGRSSMVIIDPAAFQRAQTDERTVADIFKNEGFMVKPARTNALAARLAVVESYLTRTVEGKAAMLVDKECTGLIQALAGKYRYKVNTKGERDQTPAKDHPASDFCFVAGTPILTPNGYIPIEQLSVGDSVCVRDGVDVITHTGNRVAETTMTVELSDGTALTCTPDHPFAVNSNTCYLPVDALTYDHNLVSVEEGLWANGKRHTQARYPLSVCVNTAGKNLKPRNGESTKEKVSFAALSAGRLADAIQTVLYSMGCGLVELAGTSTTGTNGQIKLPYRCTSTHGNFTTGRPPKDLKSTTRTVTQQTTLSRIWNLLTLATTAGCTYLKKLHLVCWTLTLRSRKQEKPPKNGIDHQKGASGTASTLRNQNDLQNRLSTYVPCAGKNMLGLREHTNGTTAPLNVTRSSYGPSARVFNLTTARTHTYYAGTALVHNCDALQYSCLQHDGGQTLGGKMQSGKREVKPASSRGWT